MLHMVSSAKRFRECICTRGVISLKKSLLSPESTDRNKSLHITSHSDAAVMRASLSFLNDNLSNIGSSSTRYLNLEEESINGEQSTQLASTKAIEDRP